LANDPLAQPSATSFRRDLCIEAVEAAVPNENNFHVDELLAAVSAGTGVSAGSDELRVFFTHFVFLLI
jgi:hypothetical protein